MRVGPKDRAEATDSITNVLIMRRDLIGKAWFSRVDPFEAFTIAGRRLHYTDLGQKYNVLPAEDYKYSLFSLDDDSGSPVTPANGSTYAVPPRLADSHFLDGRSDRRVQPRPPVTRPSSSHRNDLPMERNRSQHRRKSPPRGRYWRKRGQSVDLKSRATSCRCHHQAA